MIQFITISNPIAPQFTFFWSLCKSAFPTTERRSKKGQIQCLKKPNYHLEIIQENNVDVGFITYWFFDNLLYIEHLAVAPEARNGGIGRRIMEAFLKDHTYKITVLEIDPPITEIAKRRQGFYERLGFILNNHNHIQPAYKRHLLPLKMCIMSYLRIATAQEYAFLKKNLYSGKICLY